MTGVDQETSEYFDRLMRETVDSRHALECRVEKYHNETTAKFDAVFKQLGDLRAEYQALNAAVSRLEASVERLEQEFQGDRISRQQLLREVEDLRSERAAIDERLNRLEAALRRDHDA